jgi:hypothetical protein
MRTGLTRIHPVPPQGFFTLSRCPSNRPCRHVSAGSAQGSPFAGFILVLQRLIVSASVWPSCHFDKLFRSNERATRLWLQGIGRKTSLCRQRDSPLPVQSCPGLHRPRGLSILMISLSSKRFRLPAFHQIWVPELVRPPAVLLIRILSRLLRVLTPLSRFLRLYQPTRLPSYGFRYFFT